MPKANISDLIGYKEGVTAERQRIFVYMQSAIDDALPANLLGLPSTLLAIGNARRYLVSSLNRACFVSAEYVSPVPSIMNIILALNSDERLIFLDSLRDNVCLHCGNPDPRCQCSNDE